MRIDYREVLPEARRALAEVDRAVRGSSLERKLLKLVKVRASQINGCAYCLDKHTKDARAIGETEQRLNLVLAWARLRDSSADIPPSKAPSTNPKMVPATIDVHMPRLPSVKAHTPTRAPIAEPRISPSTTPSTTFRRQRSRNRRSRSSVVGLIFPLA